MAEPKCTCGWAKDLQRALKLHLPNCAARKPVATEKERDEFLRAYITCALWSEMDNSDPNTGTCPSALFRA